MRLQCLGGIASEGKAMRGVGWFKGGGVVGYGWMRVKLDGHVSSLYRYLCVCVCSIKEPPIIFGPDLLYTVTILVL